MKILLTGALGQVGWELQRTLSAMGAVRATDRRVLDLTDEAAIREAVRSYRPDWVVNAAAYTAVDEAEVNEPTAMWMNAEVPRILAEEVARLDGWLVHYSTDYVFSGAGTRPYIETDPTGPVCAYGRSKLAGELAVSSVGVKHLLFRVSWVYGLRGRNFLTTIRRLVREHDAVRVVVDQVGVPTWSRQVAEATALVMAQQPTAEQAGIYHVSGTSHCSWHAFAETILRHDQDQPRAGAIRAVSTSEYPTAAKRPAYSVLDGSHLAQVFGVRPAPWESQLALCMAESHID